MLAFVALSFQLLSGAGAPRCATADHAGTSDGQRQSVAMAGMPMSDGDATGHSGHTGDGCDEQQTAPVCQSASACAVVAIPAAAAAFFAAEYVAARPLSFSTTLLSALRTPDLPPPRA